MNQASTDAAKRLLQSKNEIIAQWEKLVRAEFAEAQHETKPHLVDSLPQFLDYMVDVLTKGSLNPKHSEKIMAVSQEHAADRVTTTEFGIEHIIREYNILRKVILEVLESDKLLEAKPRNLIVDVIQTAQSNATVEFAELTLNRERSYRKKLAENEEVFKTIFDLAAAGKAIVDQSSGRFLQVNQRFCDMLGYTKDELLQKTTASITHPEDINLLVNKPLVVNPSDSLVGKVWTIEKRYLHKDGTPMWALVSGALFPASTEEPQRVIATVFDITEKKQIEILKDQFINTLTHDLRTPLSVISMAAELLRLKKNDEQMVEKLAERITANAERGDRMIQDLLDTSRIRSGHGISLKLEECNLAKITKDTVDTLTTLYGDRFIINGGELSIQGYWSSGGLRRIIENLCSNAIKYGAKNIPVLITISESHGMASIAVHNRGEAIPAENMATLFQQFSRARSAQSSGKLGWGIGLTVVKGITEAHCGDITVESTAQEGTTFTVTLPLDPRPCREERINQGKK